MHTLFNEGAGARTWTPLFKHGFWQPLNYLIFFIKLLKFKFEIRLNAYL